MRVPLFVSPSPDSNLSSFISGLNASSITVLADARTKRFCYPLLKTLLPKHKLLITEAGEENKTLATCEKVWAALTTSQADRNALIINLGGGLITDLGGFCAALYKRGVRFINIPTTLLAQADAAMGGKTGVDFSEFKNQIGLFAEPAAIFSFTDFLKTLPEPELLSGLAEVAKHCLIADADEWNKLRKREPENLDYTHYVGHSAKIKTGITESDFRENSLRKLLNFGHTIGHALESHLLESNRKLPHGHCVAAGMAAESFIAFKRGLLSEDNLEKIEEYVFSVWGMPVFEVSEIPAIAERTLNDKKNRDGKIGCVMLSSPGNADPNGLISKKEVADSLHYICQK